MPFWNFSQFEAELDRLALWGVNLPLAFQAQEATEDRVYRSFGLNESEINAYISGPAFLPWQRSEFASVSVWSHISACAACM